MNVKNFGLPGVGWLGTTFGHCKNLLRVLYYRYPYKTANYFFMHAITGVLVYPLTVFLGKPRTISICKWILLNTMSKDVLLPLPAPLVGRIQLHERESGYQNLYGDDEYHRYLLRKGMVVVDIGAYVGLYTCMAAEIVGSTGKVVAFEPDPNNFTVLTHNSSLNGFTNVILVQSAVSDKAGTAKLYIKHHGTVSSLQGDGDHVNIAVNTLDRALDGLGVRKVDVIKIDVEGYEMNVLRGANNTINNNPDLIFIIASYHYPEEKREVREFLEERGYQTNASPEGIIFASKPHESWK